MLPQRGCGRLERLVDRAYVGQALSNRQPQAPQHGDAEAVVEEEPMDL